MKTLLEKLPEGLRDLIYLAGRVAVENKVSAYLVGGFVRDLILDVKNLDLDIVVEGDGIKFAQDFAKRLNARIIQHRRFGTAKIIILFPSAQSEAAGWPKDSECSSRILNQRGAASHYLKIDIATARKESYPQPASLPIVTPGILADDLKRRDFTINAMAISISGEDFGRLVDFFDGRSDLSRRKIRILHNLSFVDDPTRMIRAIRFEKRYNFNIEVKTLKLFKEAVKAGMIEKVQPQRLRDELILLLKEERPLNAMRRTQKLIGFNFLAPGVYLSRDKIKLLFSIQRQVGWFKEKHFRHRQLDSWLVYFIGLLDGCNMNGAASICGKFVFRKGEEKRILDYKKIGRGFIARLSRKNIKSSKVFSLLEPLSFEVIILIMAKYKNKNIQKHIGDFFEIYNSIRLCVSGHDLNKSGIKPGPIYQKVLKQILNAKLDGMIKTREEELGLLEKIMIKHKR